METLNGQRAMTVKDYADKEGISLVAAYKRIHSGKVKHKKIGSLYLVLL
jgi:hypothetical protein